MKFLLIDFKKNVQLKTDCLKILAALSTQELQLQKGKKWSAIQIADHIRRVEESTIDSIIKYQSKAKRLPFSAFIKSKILIYFLNSSRNFKIPRREDIYPSNELSLKELEEQWDHCHKKWTDYLTQHPKRIMKTAFKHPHLGYLNLAQTLAFIFAHSKRHIKQIERLNL